MKLPLRVVAPCEVRAVINFFTVQNKLGVEVHREVCLGGKGPIDGLFRL